MLVANGGLMSTANSVEATHLGFIEQSPNEPHNAMVVAAGFIWGANNRASINLTGVTNSHFFQPIHAHSTIPPHLAQLVGWHPE